jgi:hypothetical protein
MSDALRVMKAQGTVGGTVTSPSAVITAQVGQTKRLRQQHDLAADMSLREQREGRSHLI